MMWPMKEIFRLPLIAYLFSCSIFSQNITIDAPKIILKDTAVDAICHGADVGVNGISRVETGILVGNRVALLTRKGEVVALGEATFPTGALMKADKGIGIRTTRVLMETKTYPSMWKRSKKD